MLPRKPKICYRYLKSGIEEFHRKYVLVPAETLLLFGGCTTLILEGKNWVALRLMYILPKKRSLSSITIVSIMPPGLL